MHCRTLPWAILVASGLAGLIACGAAEPNSPTTDDPVRGEPPGSADPRPGGETGQSGGEPTPGTPDAPPPAVVFNEVLAVGAAEWIELVNAGATTLDIGEHFVAGSSKQSAEPKLSSAMRFPAGTTLPPGGRVLILTSRDDEPVGPHPKAECLPDGPDTCFYASFGVSATTGESIHFLGPDGRVIVTTSVPVSASLDAGGTTSESQCRLPDLTGDFARCALTPGLPNRAL